MGKLDDSTPSDGCCCPQRLPRFLDNNEGLTASNVINISAITEKAYTCPQGKSIVASLATSVATSLESWRREGKHCVFDPNHCANNTSGTAQHTQLHKSVYTSSETFSTTAARKSHS